MVRLVTALPRFATFLNVSPSFLSHAARLVSLAQSSGRYTPGSSQSSSCVPARFCVPEGCTACKRKKIAPRPAARSWHECSPPPPPPPPASNDPFDQMLKQLHAAEAAGGERRARRRRGGARLRRSRRSVLGERHAAREDGERRRRRRGVRRRLDGGGREGGSFSAPDDERTRGRRCSRSWRSSSGLLGARAPPVPLRAQHGDQLTARRPFDFVFTRLRDLAREPSARALERTRIARLIVATRGRSQTDDAGRHVRDLRVPCRPPSSTSTLHLQPTPTTRRSWPTHTELSQSGPTGS